MKKKWLITGGGKGFGFAWSVSALERGDSVLLLTRNVKNKELIKIKEKYNNTLFLLETDISNKDSIEYSINKGIKILGGIDIVINNAGYGLFGSIEDLPEKSVRDIIDVNLLGSLFTIQTVLPYLRKQDSGHIIQISSIAGIIGFPGMGMYNATKWGVEGLCETLIAELKSINSKIYVTIVEPGPFLTDWKGSSAEIIKSTIYPSFEKYVIEYWPRLYPQEVDKIIEPLLELVDMEYPPSRIILGEDKTKEVIYDEYKNKIKIWKQN